MHGSFALIAIPGGKRRSLCGHLVSTVRYERRKQDHTFPSPIERCIASSQGSAISHEESSGGHLQLRFTIFGSHTPPRRTLPKALST